MFSNFMFSIFKFSYSMFSYSVFSYSMFSYSMFSYSMFSYSMLSYSMFSYSMFSYFKQNLIEDFYQQYQFFNSNICYVCKRIEESKDIFTKKRLKRLKRVKDKIKHKGCRKSAQIEKMLKN